MNSIELNSTDPDRLLFRICSLIGHKIWTRSDSPQLEPVARQCAKSFMLSHKNIINAFHKIWPKRYTDADPFKIIYVDPNKIVDCHQVTSRRGWVVSGSGAEHIKPFFELPIPNCLRKKYTHGLAWEDPDFKQLFIDALEENQGDWTYSEQSYQRRCEKIERLYDAIQTHGYRTQKELLASDRKGTYESCNDTIHPLLNEIGVTINKSGDYLWNRCGKHRLTFARILDIEAVPVMVYMRHEEWQKVRNEIHETSNMNELSEKAQSVLDHPDSRDLVVKYR